jgi:hypothetical protein
VTSLGHSPPPPNEELVQDHMTQATTTSPWLLARTTEKAKEDRAFSLSRSLSLSPSSRDNVVRRC